MASLFDELKEQQGTEVIKGPPERFRKKGLIRKTGEFIAPTTTGLLAGEKEASLRTLAGAGLETASFIPAAGLLRGAGLGLRALGAAKLAGKAVRGARTITATERALQAGRQLGTAARIGAREGAIAGGLFETGRTLGEEETPLGEVLQRGAVGIGAGALGGATLLPATQLIGTTARSGFRAASQGFRTLKRALPPKTRKEAIENLAQSYEMSFLDRSSINNKLDLITQQAKRVRGPNTPETLIREFADYGFVPEVKGKFANMRPTLDELAERRKDLANRLDVFLEPIKTKTTVANLKRRAIREVQEDFAVNDINKAIAKINSIFTVVKRKFGNSLSAKNVNKIRKEMNEATKRFFEKEKIQDDALIAVANATRQVLDEIAPSAVVHGINNEIGRLFILDKVARVFNNKRIDPGIFGTFTGRLLGTIAGAGLGLSVSGGPGGLVIAGALATLGSEQIARMIRVSRFNPQILNIIRQGVNRNRQLKIKILREATKLKMADRNLLEKVFK